MIQSLRFFALDRIKTYAIRDIGMNLLSLSLLEAIVRTASYSGAAKEKNFSVAKVSFHINNLQDELNLILFEKVGRQMRLTKDGEKVLEEQGRYWRPLKKYPL